jgi:hypothetical protein
MAGQGEACRGCATADVLRDRIAELEAEVEALKHDLARAIRRNTELLNPNT